MKAIASARRFAGVLALAALVAAIAAVPASAGHNGAVVDVDVGACGETTVVAQIADPAGTHRVANMRLVVDVDERSGHRVSLHSISRNIGRYIQRASTLP